jgi:hypothetical protein
MNSKQTRNIVIVAIIATVALTGIYSEINNADAEKDEEPEFIDNFDLGACTWSSTGSNTYFVLEPGYQLLLKGREGSSLIHLTITVQDETRIIEGIQTRVVEERETVDGILVEVSRNFFAICNENNNVFYFGEDVDIYQGGQVVSHDGAWLHGADGAEAGLMMSGSPAEDYAYYQEIAPGVALDRAVIESLDKRVKTPAGVFEDSLEIVETTPLEPTAEDFKLYAPNIGLVKSNTLKLIGYGYV